MAEGIDDTKQWTREHILGSGAFGIVELWKNTSTLERIAMKKCHISLNDLTPRQRQRWNHEVLIMNQLNHPNIVSTRDVPNQIIENGNGLPVLCMEYCSKGDLRSMLNKPENLCGIEEQNALRIIYDVASAVEYLHKHKITHRDLKPNNIVIQERNNRLVYKLIDLGYAKELGDASVSASIVGTLNYLAPELLWKETYSCSVDYWSLGILFYEIITGTRPFLPNMQLNKVWMNHIKKKHYEDISAREIKGQVYFFQGIEDHTYLSNCLKLDLVQWFRIVFQWDPKKRGKLRGEPASDVPIVFTMLRSILDKKIVRTFIVSHFEFKSYSVNSQITVRVLKQIIHDNEDVPVNCQILTDSAGSILNDDEILSDKMLQDNVFIVFHSEKLCIESIPKAKMPQPVHDMLKFPRGDCDHHTLRRYYSATMFFMKNEIEAYRSYILALSIIIDLCDARLIALSTNIHKMISEKECLVTELESTSELMHNRMDSECIRDFEKLKLKINKFFDGIKQMMGKFEILSHGNKQLKNFSDIDWMNGILTPYDKASKLINEWYTENPNRLHKPYAMVRAVFEFLAVRDKQLSSPQLAETGRNITLFQKKLIQLEKVLTSFMELLRLYRQDIHNLRESYLKQHETVNRVNQSSIENRIFHNDTENEIGSTTLTSITTLDDSMIYESIVICNMLGGLVTEMDVWRRKLAALSNLDD